MAGGLQAAADVFEVGHGDAEHPAAAVQQAAAAVVEAAGVEGQVVVGGFQGAVAVVEGASDAEPGLAGQAQGPQLPALVVQAGSGGGQGTAAFDQALAVVQGTSELQLDLPGADLAGAVVQVPGADMQSLLGEERAVAVVEAAIGRGFQGGAAVEGGHLAGPVVEVARLERQVALLGNHLSALVAGVGRHIEAQGGLGLQ